MDFVSFRPLLFSIAYRMLGNVADAEDVVQDAFVRVQNVDWTELDNPRAYVATIVTRLCIDHLRSAHTKKELPSGVWLPEPASEVDSLNAGELAESLSIAFLTMLHNLAPIQRAAFLLHEVFDFDYPEIARIIGKSAVNVRQIVSRARKNLEGKPRFQTTDTDLRDTIARFVEAARSGEISQLLELLAPNVALYADGGAERPRYGRLRAVVRPIRGIDRVARFVLAAQAQAPLDAVNEIATINSSPAILTRVGAHLVGVLTFDVMKGRIQNIFILADPKKLGRLEASGICIADR